MSGNSDKAAGIANEAIGKAKQGIGNVVGSDKLKAEGAAQIEGRRTGSDRRRQECNEGCGGQGRRGGEKAPLKL